MSVLAVVGAGYIGSPHAQAPQAAVLPGGAHARHRRLPPRRGASLAEVRGGSQVHGGFAAGAGLIGMTALVWRGGTIIAHAWQWETR